MTLGDDAAPPGHQHEPRVSIPLGEIWTALTSEIGGIFTDNPDSTTDGSGTTASPVTVTMITTEVPVPVHTTTVDTTLVKTSFITVRVTTQIPIPHPYTSQGGDPQSSEQTITTTRQHTTLPEIVTRSTTSPTTSGPGSQHTEQSATAPSSTSSPAISSNSSDRKHAIIGGLSGAIAGLVLIGALIIFFLRKRRRRDEDGESRESMSEKGFRPILARKWSELTTRKSVAEPQPAVSRGSTPDLDGGLIRVSMENWARPYANGQSFRESMGPRRLQVMNPDPSRPETPLRRSSDSNAPAGGFLRQPRSAFAALLGNRSRGNSATRTPSRDANIPTIAIQPAGSSGHGTPQGATPSFRSYSSVTSLPVVEQHPPEDPFLTPPDERDELSTPSTPRRPGATPLQSAGKTLSQLGSALNPFRSKSNMTMKSQASRRSVSTFISSSSAGDPFALDRPSVYERSLRRQGSENDRSPRRAGSDAEPPEVPRWAVYEGT